ncbi:MAG: DUF2924 domain-containing protein [Pseudomonadota bacterium]
MKAAARVAAIEAMSAKERKREWEARINTPSPPAYGSGLLARALTWQVQAKAYGGLSKAEIKRLTSFGSSGKMEPATGGVLPGTWLSRTWRGEVHQVIVLESGFEYRGQRWSSLSEIARHITGAHWSGPRFFGLKSPRLGRLKVTDGQ